MLQAARRRRRRAEAEESPASTCSKPRLVTFPSSNVKQELLHTSVPPALGCCAGLSVTWLWCSPDRPHICPCLHILTGKEQLCLTSPELPPSRFKHCRANNKPCRSCRNRSATGRAVWGGSRNHSGHVGPMASPACRCLESSHCLQTRRGKWWRGCARPARELPLPPHPSGCLGNSPHRSWALRSCSNTMAGPAAILRAVSNATFKPSCECATESQGCGKWGFVE